MELNGVFGIRNELELKHLRESNQMKFWLDLWAVGVPGVYTSEYNNVLVNPTRLVRILKQHSGKFICKRLDIVISDEFVLHSVQQNKRLHERVVKSVSDTPFPSDFFQYRTS